MSQDHWCGYCTHRQRCDVEDCKHCYDSSFASSYRSKYWHPTKNKFTPRQISKNSKQRCWFICDKCNHEFDQVLCDISCRNYWCYYCSNDRRCSNEDCKMCFENSFASNPKSLLWHATKNKVTPRQVAKRDNDLYWFTCDTCNHDFQKSPDRMAKDGCPFCSGHRRCPNGTCIFCKQSCEICFKLGVLMSKKSRRICCKECLIDIIKRDPEETPLQLRAKVSMEIYALCELQRTARLPCFLGLEPTSWDCPILPSLNFKPDIMWCFDDDDNVFETAGACKLNSDEITYALVLEVVEVSRKHHSAHRSIPDQDREHEIRNLFNGRGVMVGFVYLTVAHTNQAAAQDDVFFHKLVGVDEYSVMDSRLDAWKLRIGRVTETLLDLKTQKSNETVYVGN